jgi:hypothetical protein
MIWEKYHEVRLSHAGMISHRLGSLFGAGVGEPSKPGVLNDIPSDIYEPWMLENKDERMPFILNWIQLFEGTGSARKWSAAFVGFVDAHVDRADRLDTLRRRFTTGTWWGSYADKLHAELEMLSQLRGLSKNSYVHRWVDRTMSGMEQQISEERRHDANREASYRA